MLSTFGLFAQKQVIIEHDYSGFDAVTADNYFEIAVLESDEYSVKITAISSIEDYILAYVKDGVLNLSVDEKGMPGDVRKEFKAKSSALGLPKAEVYMPKLKKLTINGNATYNSEEAVETDTLTLSLTKEAIIKNLSVKADVVNVDMSQKAQAYMTLDAAEATVKALQNSRGELKLDVDKLDASTGSYAVLELYGYAGKISLATEGNSKITFEED